MDFRRKKLVMVPIVVALCGTVCLHSGASAEALTTASVEQIVRKSPGFGKDRKVTVAVQGGEVDISTYVLTANAPATDLKIEALSVSKGIIEANSSVARVKLRFYEPTAPSNYREVVVTISDIKAFSSGAITKDQLLAALNVEARTDGVAAGAGSSNSRLAGYMKDHKGPQGAKMRFTAEGISLEYSKPWVISDEPPEQGYFVKFSRGDGSHMSIRRTTSNKDVSVWVADEDQEHEGRRDYARVAVPQQLRIGQQGGITAYNRAYSRTTGGKLIYHQYVYFGWPKNRYKFKLVAPQRVYVRSAQEFAGMLGTVQVAR